MGSGPGGVRVPVGCRVRYAGRKGGSLVEVQIKARIVVGRGRIAFLVILNLSYI